MPNQFPALPAALVESVNSRAAWQNDITVAYRWLLTADRAKDVSALALPLDKSGWQPFSLAVNASRSR
ncbi:hypothetical protein [Sodalis sp.]|uniref:hypothetical protein n=1 Tax=Sodalis sp. (in: enterobacteria) TaxID=1898979 RepID=UPI0038732D7D